MIDSFILVWRVHRRYDTNGGIQHEESNQRQCNHKGNTSLLGYIPIRYKTRWDSRVALLLCLSESVQIG